MDTSNSNTQAHSGVSMTLTGKETPQVCQESTSDNTILSLGCRVITNQEKTHLSMTPMPNFDTTT